MMNALLLRLRRATAVAMWACAPLAMAQAGVGKGPLLELGEVNTPPGARAPAAPLTLSSLASPPPSAAMRPETGSAGRAESTLPDAAQRGAHGTRAYSSPTPGSVVGAADRRESVPAHAPKTAGSGYAIPATVPAPRRDDSARAARPERLVFERRPLRIALGAEERLVTFPHPVAIALPAGAERSIDMQIIGRTVYLNALAPQFPSVRLLAEDLVTGRVIPADLVAADGAQGLPMDVEVHDRSEERIDGPADDIAAAQAAPLDMVQLTRYAVQMVYAPQRLKPAADGVTSIPIDARDLEGLFRGVRTRARALGQWRSGALYVTAVQVSNLERKAVALDAAQLRGQWLAATLQHHRLQPAGTDYDSTTLYLVCGQLFHSCR